MILLLALFALLDSPYWQAREAATRVLTPACSLTLPLLEWVEAKGSMEAGRRCRRIVNQWWLDNAPRLSREQGKMPWMSCHVVEHGYHWVNLARDNGPVDSAPNWPAWREATRLWVESRIGARLPFAEVLKRLADEEADWQRQNKQ